MSQLNDQLAPYRDIIEAELKSLPSKAHIGLFYDPIAYFLKIPGKRIRPLLVLLFAELFGQKPAAARHIAAAVELLHNFTLLHDDIMDHDPLRRGQMTVHEKWDIGTAILAGDGLMGFAFQYLLKDTAANLTDMSRRFTDTMLLICEGQGLDKMFETDTLVDEAAYMEMIANKTAVLLQLSCELGAMSAAADSHQVSLAGQFGYNLGMGFQIQDDLLDVFGESTAIGKKAGSDLEMHKQTICTIRLQAQRPQLDIYDLSLNSLRRELEESGVRRAIETLYNGYFSQATENLQQLPSGPAREILAGLLEQILHRKL